ncbi:hypothetical protein IscW_ISCW019690 [Ixodes scapularis]|uniref:Uncharacterized protein n=1 Tax=Ixodes scapularis TaxID=6945 RepID=B7PW00_IXOSC|nr:hypothetical protein IscW_ISCW019690 [Ixodes scapularis]|eukprot:XP_002408900.1 hypothetical protein IscW_ISCW019690 [Ixodes scapularis]
MAAHGFAGRVHRGPLQPRFARVRPNRVATSGGEPSLRDGAGSIAAAVTSVGRAAASDEDAARPPHRRPDLRWGLLTVTDCAVTKTPATCWSELSFSPGRGCPARP